MRRNKSATALRRNTERGHAGATADPAPSALDRGGGWGRGEGEGVAAPRPLVTNSLPPSFRTIRHHYLVEKFRRHFNKNSPFKPKSRWHLLLRVKQRHCWWVLFQGWWRTDPPSDTRPGDHCWGSTLNALCTLENGLVDWSWSKSLSEGSFDQVHKCLSSAMKFKWIFLKGTFRCALIILCCLNTWFSFKKHLNMRVNFHLSKKKKRQSNTQWIACVLLAGEREHFCH